MAIITVSRGSMSGGEAVARRVAEELHYPLIGREIVVDAAAKLGVPEDTLTKKFERSPSLWERLTSDRKTYITAVQAALAEHAVAGDLVYHGHAGHLLLKGVPSVLRVRLIAPLEMRVRAVMAQQKLARAEAVDYIENVDEERVRWTKFIYGVDWSNPSLYDLVVNLENMSIETACQIVVHATRQPDYAMTDAVREQLRNFVLACRVKVALAANPQTRGLDLDVQAHHGAIAVSGQVPTGGMLSHTSTRTEDEITRTAQQVEGVKAVTLNIEKFDAYH